MVPFLSKSKRFECQLYMSLCTTVHETSGWESPGIKPRKPLLWFCIWVRLVILYSSNVCISFLFLFNLDVLDWIWICLWMIFESCLVLVLNSIGNNSFQRSLNIEHLPLRALDLLLQLQTLAMWKGWFRTTTCWKTTYDRGWSRTPFEILCTFR